MYFALYILPTRLYHRLSNIILELNLKVKLDIFCHTSFMHNLCRIIHKVRLIDTILTELVNTRLTYVVYDYTSLFFVIIIFC